MDGAFNTFSTCMILGRKVQHEVFVKLILPVKSHHEVEQATDKLPSRHDDDLEKLPIRRRPHRRISQQDQLQVSWSALKR